MKTKKYKSLAIIGLQWGDEGKGKITNFFANYFDYVVRFQGGGNAGHSIEIDDRKYVLHLLPTGVINTKAINVLGGGMVIDPFALLREINYLQEEKIKKIKILISKKAHLVLPYHYSLDSKSKHNQKIGTTNMGIGPAYMDKINRVGIRFADLYDRKDLSNLLEINYSQKSELFKKTNFVLSQKSLFKKMIKIGEIFKNYIVDESYLLNSELDEGKKILFEGAQGTMLSLEHGTYPYVTSSDPNSGAIFSNCGIAPQKLKMVLGVVKAYTTRVGAGPFPTEFNNSVSQKIQTVGNEFGKTTGRARRIGWLDCVVLKHSAMINGCDYISVTLLDVLSGLKKVKIAYGYKLKGKLLQSFPTTKSDFEKLEVRYLELEGWDEDISKIKNYQDLPENAKIYLSKIEEYTGIKIAQISVGPDIKQTINIIDLKKELKND